MGEPKPLRFGDYAGEDANELSPSSGYAGPSRALDKSTICRHDKAGHDSFVWRTTNDLLGCATQGLGMVTDKRGLGRREVAAQQESMSASLTEDINECEPRFVHLILNP